MATVLAAVDEEATAVVKLLDSIFEQTKEDSKDYSRITSKHYSQLHLVDDCMQCVRDAVQQDKVENDVWTVIYKPLLFCKKVVLDIEYTIALRRDDGIIEPPERMDSLCQNALLILKNIVSAEAYQVFELRSVLIKGDTMAALKIVDKDGAAGFTDSQGRTMLHVACKAGSKDIVQAILKAGADPNARDEYGSSPLFYAASHRDEAHGDLVHILLEAGASVDVVDTFRRSALHAAVQCSTEEVVKVLLQYNADPLIISDFGETPESLAREIGGSIAELFNHPPPPIKRKSIPTDPQSGLFGPPPDFERQAICEHFRGLIWSPKTEDLKPRIWELIYNDKTSDEVAKKLEESRSRWIHVPLNDFQWIKDVTQNVISKDYCNERKEGFKLFQKISTFAEKHFKGKDVSAKIEIERFTDPSLKLLSLVVPTLDVDFENDAKVELLEGTRINPGQKKDYVESTTMFLQHIQRMHETTAYLRCTHSLYSSTGDFSEVNLQERIRHQVLCRYLLEVKASSESHELKEDIANNTVPQYGSPHFSDILSRGKHKTPKAREPFYPFKPPGKPRIQSKGSPKKFRTRLEAQFEAGQRKLEASQATVRRLVGTSALRGVIIPQLWIFIIILKDHWTIISAFPDRWDTSIEPTLPDTIRRALANLGDQKIDAKTVARQILLCCNNFIEQTFYLRKFAEVTYNRIFTDAIADLSDSLAYRYDQLKGKDSSLILPDLITEVEDLKKIDDIIYEIDIIKRILNEQEHVKDKFEESISSLLELYAPESSNTYIHPTSKSFERLGIEAQRVRNSLITLLDLKQRFATIEDARLTATQTTILIIFTLATVIFSPLLLAVAVLALKINGLPDSFHPGFVVKVCIWSLTSTLVLIVILISIYGIYIKYGDRMFKFFQAAKSHYKPFFRRQQSEDKSQTGKRARGTEKSVGKTSQSTRIDQEARLRSFRYGDQSNDLERGQQENKVRPVAAIVQD